MKKGVSKFKVSLMAALAASVLMATSASANVQKALNNAGIKQTGSADGIYGDLTNVVYLIIGIGGIWGIAWLVIGAMILAGSGGNPQKRGQGLAALFTACVGLFIMYKAYDIAGWATGIGG